MFERSHRDTLPLVRLAQRAIGRAVDYRIDNSLFFKTDRQFILAVGRAVTIKIERAHQSTNGPGTLAGRCFAQRLPGPQVDRAPGAKSLAYQHGQFSQARQAPLLFPVHMNALPGVLSKASELSNSS